MPRAVDGWKQCSKCREVKEVGEFYKNKNTPDGLLNRCKACQDKLMLKRNREKANEYDIDYKQNFKETYGVNPSTFCVMRNRRLREAFKAFSEVAFQAAHDQITEELKAEYLEKKQAKEKSNDLYT